MLCLYSGLYSALYLAFIRTCQTIYTHPLTKASLHADNNELPSNQDFHSGADFLTSDGLRFTQNIPLFQIGKEVTDSLLLHIIYYN